MPALTVAIDTGPLIGDRTGIGQFTALLIDALAALDEPPTIVPYVLSGRATLPSGTRRLPYPARAALAMWGRAEHPVPRRSLRGVDVIHGTNFVVPPTALGSVVTVHDCSPMTRPELVDPVVRAFVPVLRRAVARGAFVHVPSAFVGDQVRDVLAVRDDRIRVIPHGAPRTSAVSIDDSGDDGGHDGDSVGNGGDGESGSSGEDGSSLLSGSLAPLSGRAYVLALGTREPRKNLVTLVRAFGVLAAHDRDLLLALVGPPGSDDAAITAAIEALDASARARVLVHGFVGADERATLFRHANVLAYPSLDEGFGLPMIEAMAAGVPVVAARAGALPEVAGEAAALVDPLDIDGLAGALAAIVGDADRGAALRRAGLANVARFSWAASARSMVELYRDAMASSRPARSRRTTVGDS